ncbi:hypothetical protein COY95_04010, partial [Candidatus Woesearchaeota archaeon CG_4_10_14_0_8_um_filter_47_5]
IRRNRGEIYTGASVTQVDFWGGRRSRRGKGDRVVSGKQEAGEGIRVSFTHQGKEQTLFPDALITTIPVPEFLRVSSGLPDDYVKKVSQVRYCPVVGCVIGTEKFLSPFYWHNVFGRDVHMIVQHSLLYDGYGDKISWVSRYGGSEQDFGLSDDEIKKKYLSVVKEFFPKANVKWAVVYKNTYAEPVYDKDYPLYMPKNRSPVPGLYYAGIATTYPKIRNMNTALESGISVARMVGEDLEGT